MCVCLKAPIVPADNAASLIASKLKNLMGDTPWYSRALSQLSSMPSSTSTMSKPVDKISLMGMKSDAALRSNISLGSPIKATGVNDSDTSINIPSMASNAKRKTFDFEDPDEAKYQRRQNPLLTGSGAIPSFIRSIM